MKKMSKLNEDIIIRYLENRCSEEDFVLINEWMKESDENAGELFRMEEIYQLGKFPFEEENLVVRAERRLGRRLEQENQKKQEVFKLRSVLRYAAAIVGVMVLAAGLAYWFRNKAEELVVASAAHGQVREMLLPDGTKVWLNQSSVLKYPRAFEGKERHVYLDGEAYFEVARNHEKPFMVKSPAMDVRVLGTSFNIKCRPDNSFAETTLIEGEVEVKDKSDKGRITLLPGQKAVLNRVTGRMQVKQVDPKMEIVWHNDLIPFEKSSIFQIAAALERFYGVKIILSPDVDSTNTYSGVLKKKDNIESVLNSLRNSIPFNYKKVDDNNIFISSETK
jgi:ferric-dicitrate binding protein FerR (iron transport regulator)